MSNDMWRTNVGCVSYRGVGESLVGLLQEKGIPLGKEWGEDGLHKSKFTFTSFLFK